MLKERRRRVLAEKVAAELVSEWFPEQKACFDDPGQLVAALCSRRAGKTRAGNKHLLREASTTPHGRYLYVNSTLGEAKRLAWYGARGDGMASLVERLKLPAIPNEAELTIHFPKNDAWIYLRGVDDEKRLMQALGTPFHEILWDEAQKIPRKLAPTIDGVLMPTLLDYRGRLRFNGTPSRNMGGIFYDITRPEKAKRRPGWSVHHWTLLNNPFFGRPTLRSGRWFVVDGIGNVLSGPHEEPKLQAAVAGGRMQRGMRELQQLYGGEQAAPLDSPLMRREGFGVWVYEDANLVYPVHSVPRSTLCYAPARLREDGYPDIVRALMDLPGWGDIDYFLSLGADLGYSPDPFAWVLWGWSLMDPVLYEVASWKRTLLDSDEQAQKLRDIRDLVTIAITTADAGGGGKQVVAGWSKKWMERYGISIVEATKKNKHGAIDAFGTDMRRGHIRVREGGAWLEEAENHHWSRAGLVSASGKLIEDPTTENHCCDAGLYAHRESYHYRYRPEDLPPAPGSAESIAREEAELEAAAIAETDERPW